jgi:hypothetical protein
MAEVYGNATVNIAASQVEDGTFGLFVERTGYKVGRKYFETSGGDIYELIPKHMAETFLVGSPLSKRAWAFQERYLAQRTLHFTAEQIFAECNQHIACEAWPRGVPETWELREFPKFPKGLHKKDWTRTVYHYLEGQLTYPKDILVALSGVARQFQERLQDQYVAGLWMKQLPWQLCWRSKLSNRYSLQSTLKLPYRAPSWSWASIYGPITWRLWTTNDVTDQFYSYRCSLIEVLDLELVPLGRDPFGQLRDARLQLKCGLVIKYSALRSFMREKTIWSSRAADDPFKRWSGIFVYDDGEPSDAIIESSYLLPLLKLRSTPQHIKDGEVDICGLIIAANSNSRKREFVRLGVFNVVLLRFESFEGLILFFSSQPNAVMDQSLYERSLGMDADGLMKYTIRLV